MKKVLSILMVAIMLVSAFLFNVSAATEVIFTSDSSADTSGKLKVDIEAMAEADEAIMEALFSDSVQYRWYKNDVLVSNITGDTYWFDSSNLGDTFVVEVVIPGKTIKSDRTVINELVEMPEIVTTGIPAATVGEEYYVRLECTDPDSVFGISYNPGGKNEFEASGMILTQHGEIEGTPKTAGSFTFTICVSNEAGEGYRNFTLVVNPFTKPEESKPEESESVSEPIGSVSENSDVSDGLNASGNESEESKEDSDNEKESGRRKKKNNDDLFLWLAIGGGIFLLLIVVVVIIIIVAKNKKKKKVDTKSAEEFTANADETKGD